MDAVIHAFFNFIKMIRISDVVDIAILSFVVYKLIWGTRKNSFGRVVKGVGVVLIFMLLASALKLYAVSYLFSIVVEWGVLALVIVFQPEIRRMLEKVGDSRLFHLFFSSHPRDLNSVEQTIGETVCAYSSMSGDKVGALMVFERQNHLDDVIKTGTALDAAVSAELLKNIFWNKAPLHDGAVIVRNGRIIAAGCMLPLSGNVNLSRDLGMRHRAGIGMSEHSDAVVAIVSEETGSISVAVGGMLKRHLAPETLERLLRNELLVEDSSGESVNVLSVLVSMFNKSKKGGGQDEIN
ncbi:MAG: diadenylate cyclase CdaA [Oscillospiraceae bacterium]|nr:diadenylate cyclase CdaA [Oscillospiraceae bacterium]